MFVALLTVALVLITWCRRCNLDGEPNSLASALGLLQRSLQVVEQLDNAVFHLTDLISCVFIKSSRRYRLQLVPGEGPRIEVLGGLESVPAKLGELAEKKPHPTKPEWPMSTLSGVFLVMFFVLLLVALVVLYVYDRVKNGT